MKGSIGTATRITVQLSNNDIIRKMEIEDKRRNSDKRAKIAREKRQTPVYDHLDEIAERKKKRELNRKKP